MVHPAGDSPLGEMSHRDKRVAVRRKAIRTRKGSAFPIGNEQKESSEFCSELFFLVHPAGVEPATFAVGGRHSIQLRYGCLFSAAPFCAAALLFFISLILVLVRKDGNLYLQNPFHGGLHYFELQARKLYFHARVRNFAQLFDYPTADGV